MKKKTTQLFPTADQPANTSLLSQPFTRKKITRRPVPPTEETMLKLNAIVKEAPFCFHFQAKENDFL